MKLEEFCNNIGHRFNTEELLEEALTHPSFTKKSDKKINYQRLEFLGDKVLSLVISEFLIKKYPNENEGDLSKRHAYLVSGAILSQIAISIQIDQVLKLSFGEKKLGGANNKHNLENAVEALIGAIYIDSSYEEVQKFIFKFWKNLLEEEYNPPKDPVSTLQEIVQLKTKKLPSYEFNISGGTQHNPEFEAILMIEDFNIKIFAKGKSKKEAQKNAAIAALKEVGDL